MKSHTLSPSLPADEEVSFRKARTRRFPKKTLSCVIAMRRSDAIAGPFREYAVSLDVLLPARGADVAAIVPLFIQINIIFIYIIYYYISSKDTLEHWMVVV